MSLLIERKNSLDIFNFTQNFLIKNIPVIVTDGMKNWPLLEKWSVENLVKNFGNYEVQVYNDLFDLIDVIPLENYVQEFFNLESESNKFIPYVRWYSTFKELDFVWADDFFNKTHEDWSMPYFLPRDNYIIPFKNLEANPNKILFPARGLFISAKGAKTSQHVDPWCSDAILCQVQGYKKVILYNPSFNSENELSGDKLNTTRNNEIYIDYLYPGEILFIPHSWPHEVYSLSDSVSLTWNFVHFSTLKSFIKYLANSPPDEELEIIKFFLKLS